MCQYVDFSVSPYVLTPTFIDTLCEEVWVWEIECGLQSESTKPTLSPKGKNRGLRHLMKRHSQHSVHGDICCCCWMEADTHIAHLESHRRIEESTGMQRWSHEMERRQNITVFFQRPWCCPSFLGSPHTEGDRLSGWRYSRSTRFGGWNFHNDGRRFCKVPLEDALHGWLSAGFRLGNYIC